MIFDREALAGSWPDLLFGESEADRLGSSFCPVCQPCPGSIQCQASEDSGLIRFDYSVAYSGPGIFLLHE